MNFSAAQFHNAGILQIIVQALADAKVAPSRLEVEITESMLLSKYDSAASTLKALLELGITVALDDFGTGFSSLTYLRKLPFNRIKVDQSFIRRHAGAAGLRGDRQVGDLARARPQHRRRRRRRRDGRPARISLRQFGCDEAQGYLISRPLPAENVLSLLAPKKIRAIYAAWIRLRSHPRGAAYPR